MGFATHALVTVAATALLPLLPSPLDKDGWGLRVRGLTVAAPYLAGERIDIIKFQMLLLNRSVETRLHTPLEASQESGDLDISLFKHDGKGIQSLRFPGVRVPFTQQVKLPAGQFVTAEFSFAAFGYDRLPTPGRHWLKASLIIDGKKISAPPVELEVIEPPADAILATHPVPLAGIQASRPVDERSRAAVQQVRIGERTLLVYHRFYGPKYGGGADLTARLAELPGKVEMSVAGSYGGGKPLTLKYKHSPTGTTTLTVNSIDGTVEKKEVLEK